MTTPKGSGPGVRRHPSGAGAPRIGGDGRRWAMLVASRQLLKLGPLVRIEDRGELRVNADPQRIEPGMRHTPDVAQVAPVTREDGPGRVLLDRREAELFGQRGHHVPSPGNRPEHHRVVPVPPDDYAMIDGRAREERDEECGQDPTARSVHCTTSPAMA